MFRTCCIAIGLAALVGAGTAANSQPAMPDVSKTANPELVGELTRELQITPQQAEGAAGSLFDVAKKGMPAGDWAKVSQAVPGMDGLLKAAPAAAGGPGGVMGMAGGLGGAAAAFSKLGLKPEMVSKAVPVLTKYVSKTGGADIGSLLAAALK